MRALFTGSSIYSLKLKSYDNHDNNNQGLQAGKHSPGQQRPRSHLGSRTCCRDSGGGGCKGTGWHGEYHHDDNDKDSDDNDNDEDDNDNESDEDDDNDNDSDDKDNDSDDNDKDSDDNDNDNDEDDGHNYDIDLF